MENCQKTQDRICDIEKGTEINLKVRNLCLKRITAKCVRLLITTMVGKLFPRKKKYDGGKNKKRRNGNLSRQSKKLKCTKTVIRKRNKFCGFPIGVIQEPRFAASVSRTIKCKEERFIRLKIKSEIGTKVRSATSFVTNIELKNTR